MLEKQIENYLVSQTQKKGGWSVKLVPLHIAGLPDRICLFKPGRVHFVELKAPGEKTTALQDIQINKIRNLGCKVYIIDNKESVDFFTYLWGKGVES